MEIADDGRLRIVAGRRHVGSWPFEQVKVERTSIYRFVLELEDKELEFFPEDPSEFSEAAGAVVDLSLLEGRFGLKARIVEASTD